VTRRAGRTRLVVAIMIALTSTAAVADVLLLKDGRAVRTVGEIKREHGVVIFKIEGGTLVSLREADVDWPATARVTGLLAGAARSGRPAGPSEESEPPRRALAVYEVGQARDLESLPEEAVIGALIHTGRRRPAGPDEEEPVSARLVTTPGGAAATRRTVAGAAADLTDHTGQPTAAVAVPVGVVSELPELGAMASAPPSPFTGEGTGADARRRLAPLVEPPLPRPIEMAHLALPEQTDAGQRPRFIEPADGTAVFGATRLEARPSAGGSPVEEIEYRVDGRSVGGARAPGRHVVWMVPRARSRHELTARIRRRDGSIEIVGARVRAILPDAAVDVDLVSLSVTVTNQRYFFVRDLERDDFIVFEDGVRQEVTHFSRDPVPLTLMVLIDSSWSMNGSKLDLAVAGVRRLIERLGPDDRVGVATFAEALDVLTPVTRDHAAAAASLDSLVADGGTAMFDAEVSALERLAWEGGRRVLIVLGDGEDYTSTAGVDDVVRAAHRNDVAVYSVGILTYRLKDGMPEHWATKLAGRGRPKYWTDRARVRGLKFLKRQSETTGGVLYLPKFTGELPYVFEHVLAELKSAYSIGYYPNNQVRDGRFRKVALYVDGAALNVRTRQGYYAAEESVALVAESPPIRPVTREAPSPR